MMYGMDADEYEWTMRSANSGVGMDPLMIDDIPVLFGSFTGPQWTCNQYLPGERTAFFMDKIDAENCPVMECARRIAAKVKSYAMTGALVATIDIELLDDQRWLVAVQWRAGLISRK